MAEVSAISWTHATFNPWVGCTKVSAGCANCYAEADFDKRKGFAKWGANGTRVVKTEAGWREPLKWNREAAAAGERRRVFCASLADVFEGPETMPADAVRPVNLARARLFNTIALTPCLDWLLLTKRPQNVRSVLGEAWNVSPSAPGASAAGVDLIANWLDGKPPTNVWMGTSVENQAAADERIPHLLDAPAKVRFLSCEPLLGPVDLVRFLPNTFTGFPRGPRINWVIVGGESGPGARPMHPAWARSLRDQCVSAGVAFHFKQWGEYLHTHPSELHLSNAPVTEFEGLKLQRVGKKDAGRLLDGRTWDQLPEAQV